ncbi:MAG: condensation domain-containing protein, partial [Blastocatellia bacterium]
MELSEKVKNLSPAKRALLLQKMRDEMARVKDAKRIPRRDSDGPCPLSYAQQGLWFLDQLDPGSLSFVNSNSVRFTGSLNMAALQQSLNEIIRRHEALRTIFPIMNGQPVQIVIPRLSVNLTVVDFETLPENLFDQATQLLASMGQRPFDLAHGPLLRVSLFRINPQEFILLFTVHDIICDGWSMSLLIKEIRAIYEAYSGGETSRLEELPIQYADYAIWQRERLQGELLESEMRYWKRQLEAAPVLEMPTDRLRPAHSAYQGGAQAIVIDPTVTAALRKMSRRHSATMYMMLMAGFQVLLSRYSGQTDIVVGTPIAGRNRAGIEGLIGFFINMLAVRTRLDG